MVKKTNIVYVPRERLEDIVWQPVDYHFEVYAIEKETNKKFLYLANASEIEINSSPGMRYGNIDLVGNASIERKTITALPDNRKLALYKPVPIRASKYFDREWKFNVENTNFSSNTELDFQYRNDLFAEAAMEGVLLRKTLLDMLFKELDSYHRNILSQIKAASKRKR